MSHCLKLYCECFADYNDCNDHCNCDKRKCGNKDGISISKSKKRISPEDGCRCKESECQKNYCICFRSGKGCNSNCGCTGCKNTMYNMNEITNYYSKTKRPRIEKTKKPKLNTQSINHLTSVIVPEFTKKEISENERTYLIPDKSDNKSKDHNYFSSYSSIEEYIKLTQHKSYISTLQENVHLISSSYVLINQFSISIDEFYISIDVF